MPEPAARRPRREPMQLQGATLGARIREARAKRGMTQAKLAERVGCSNALVGFWETERAQVQDQHLTRLGQVFGLPRRALLAPP